MAEWRSGGHLNVLAVVDQYGNRTSFVYDSRDRQIATVDYLGNRSTTVFDAARQ